MVSNNFMEIRRGGGGVFERGNPWGGGTKAVSEIQVEGGGSKNRAFRWGEGVRVDCFWNNPLKF